MDLAEIKDWRAGRSMKPWPQFQTEATDWLIAEVERLVREGGKVEDTGIRCD